MVLWLIQHSDPAQEARQETILEKIPLLNAHDMDATIGTALLTVAARG